MFIKKFIQAVVLVYLYSQMVLCQGPFFKVTSTPMQGLSSETFIQLYNYKSGGYLKILNKHITANGYKNDTHALLVMGSDRKGIYVKGYVSGKFICFTKNASLKSRHKGRKKLCRFKEEVDTDQSYRLCSLFNKNWKIGFDDDGEPVPGSAFNNSNLNADNRFFFIKYLKNNLEPDFPQIIINADKVKKALEAQQKSPHPGHHKVKKTAADSREHEGPRHPNHFRGSAGKRINKRRRRRRSTTRTVTQLTTVRRRIAEVKPTAGSVLPIR